MLARNSSWIEVIEHPEDSDIDYLCRRTVWANNKEPQSMKPYDKSCCRSNEPFLHGEMLSWQKEGSGKNFYKSLIYGIVSEETKRINGRLIVSCCSAF